VQEDWLRQYLRLSNGIPSHDTIRRVFEVLSPKRLDACFAARMAQRLRALHQVSAYAASLIRLRNAALNVSFLR
jgi:hypothetical protein